MMMLRTRLLREPSMIGSDPGISHFCYTQFKNVIRYWPDRGCPPPSSHRAWNIRGGCVIFQPQIGFLRGRHNGPQSLPRTSHDGPCQSHVNHCEINGLFGGTDWSFARRLGHVFLWPYRLQGKMAGNYGLNYNEIRCILLAISFLKLPEVDSEESVPR